MSKRTAFFVSDRTGITIELLGASLLSQFEGIEFERVILPFVDTVDKAREAVRQINTVADSGNGRPLVFSSLVDDAVRDEVPKANALVLDLFELFIAPIEAELSVRATHKVGQAHGVANVKNYDKRIDAINYTLSHDDGVTNNNLDEAEVILVGVSRSGKTPTSLYLAMQFGIKAANYPIIPEDLEARRLPPALKSFRAKLFGLSIQPNRLAQIRAERRPDSTYASLGNCRYEVDAAEKLMRSHGIPYLDSTTKSIEEIATTILRDARLQRQVY